MESLLPRGPGLVSCFDGVNGPVGKFIWPPCIYIYMYIDIDVYTRIKEPDSVVMPRIKLPHPCLFFFIFFCFTKLSDTVNYSKLRSILKSMSG